MKAITIFIILLNLTTLLCEAYFKDFAEAKDKFKDSGLYCGKKEPKGKNDCIKYGTDSDFYCCYFEDPAKKDSFCGLVSYEAAGEPKGKQQFELYREGDNKLGYCNAWYYQVPLLIFALCVGLLL